MHHLHTVYSTTDNIPQSAGGNTLHLGILCAASIIAITIFIIKYIRGGRDAVIKPGGRNPFLIVFIPIGGFFFYSLFNNIHALEMKVYEHDKALLNSNSKELKVVEGTVKNYYAESKDGHGDEEFTVQGVLFHYSHFEVGRSGYHATRWYGGAIRQNLYVKITYYDDGDRNAILKLETE